MLILNFLGIVRGEIMLMDVHMVYTVSAILYLEAGISVDVGDDKMIRGFTMTYAPKYNRM